MGLRDLSLDAGPVPTDASSVRIHPNRVSSPATRRSVATPPSGGVMVGSMGDGEGVKGEQAPHPAPPAGTGSRISRARLDRELVLRGWTVADLARAAQVSATTLSFGRNGHRLSPRTLRRIAIALTKAPIIEGLENLLA